MNKSTYDLVSTRKVFSTIGLALCAILVITTILQALWLSVPVLIWGEDNWMTTSSWGKWIVSFVPLYLVAIPVGLLIMRKLPAQAPQDNRLEAKDFFVILPICFCLMYGGNLVGTWLSMLLSGGNAQNALTDYVMDTNPIKILVMVILAPLLEEFVCRKQIIDRTRQYGEKIAVILSALTFGLLHQNLFQFFYAFGLGLVFAYIYTRTGRLRYPVILHSIINLLGSVVAPWIVAHVDMDVLTSIDPNMAPEALIALYREILPGLLGLLAYALLLVGLAISGLVLLILKYKELVWKESDMQLAKGTVAKTVYLNAGMAAYILICVASCIYALF